MKQNTPKLRSTPDFTERTGYPSDVSREQFAAIKPLLENARKRTAPRRVDLYDVFCGVLYVLCNGCPWRALPKDFPDWHTVYSYFAIWREEREEGSLLHQALKYTNLEWRIKTGRNGKCSLLIVDAQSVKNASPAGSKGYDAGKKVSGIKRHIAVDSLGLLHAIAITTANVGDRDGILPALERNCTVLDGVRILLADGGYTGRPFAQGVREILGSQVEVQIVKRSDAHTFKVLPKRWIVERSFAWLERCRRLWKNCERKLNTSLQFVNLAFLALLLRRL